MERSGFFDSNMGDRRYDADDMSQPFEGLITEGIFAAWGEGLRVTRVDATTVRVGSGRAWIRRKWYYNDASVEFSLGDFTDPSYDRKVVLTLVAETSLERRTVGVKMVPGDAAPNAVSPTLTDTEDVLYMPLAEITIKRGGVNINDADIRDLRGGLRTPYVTAIMSKISTDGIIDEMRGDYDNFKQQLLANAGEQPNLGTQVESLRQQVNRLMQLVYPSQINTGRKLTKADSFIYYTSANTTFKRQAQDVVYEMFDHIPEMHNAIYRGKNLGGALTQDQKLAIKNGTFTDMWLGDYWVFNGVKYRVMSINYWRGILGTHESFNHIVLMADSLFVSSKMHTQSGSNIANGTGVSDWVVYTDALAKFRNNVAAAFGIPLYKHKESTAKWGAALDRPDTSIMVEYDVMLPTAGMLGLQYQANVHTGHTFASNDPTSTRNFPALTLNPALLRCNGEFWLQDQARKGYGMTFTVDGRIRMTDVVQTRGVRPVFGIYYP